MDFRIEKAVAAVVLAAYEDGEPIDDLLRTVKRFYVEAALRASGGHMQKAASQLGVHRNSLTRIMREVGVYRMGPKCGRRPKSPGSVTPIARGAGYARQG